MTKWSDDLQVRYAEAVLTQSVSPMLRHLAEEFREASHGADGKADKGMRLLDLAELAEQAASGLRRAIGEES